MAVWAGPRPGQEDVAPPRLALVDRPSPLRRLPDREPFRGNLFIKEEGLLAPGVGGSKVRGLEFLLGGALAAGADTVVTSAVAGSNYLAALAHHARRAGLECVAVVRPARATFRSRRNTLLAHQEGCRFVIVDEPASLRSTGYVVTELARSLEASGSRTALLPFGGGSPLAALGHVAAAAEALDQLVAEPPPGALDVVVPVGTGWTAAALVVGFAAAAFPVRVLAVPSAHRPPLPRHVVTDHLAALRSLLVSLGRPLPESAAASLAWAPLPSPPPTSEWARRAGIATEPVYTANALASFTELADAGGPAVRAILLWHTADVRAREPLDAQVRAGVLPAEVAAVLGD